MNYFILQTALLMLAAYFLGASIACAIRRMSYAEPAAKPDVSTRQSVPDTAATVATTAAAGAATAAAAAATAADEKTSRFERALTGDGSGQSEDPVPTAMPTPSAATPGPQVGSDDWTYRGESSVYGRDSERPPSDTLEPSQLRTMHGERPRAEYDRWTFEGENQVYAKPASDNAAAAGLAVVTAAAATTAVTATASREAPVAAAVAGDDLRKIRGLDDAAAEILSQAGYTSYAKIAAFQRADIDRLTPQLGDPKRISRQNWIEQAALLDKSGTSVYARNFPHGGLQLASPTPHQGEPIKFQSAPARPTVPTAAIAATAAAATSVASTATPAETTAAPPPARDELQRIRGVDADAERVLRDHGVTRYEQIAAMGRDDIARIDAQLGRNGRVSRENWIEQAQLLARGTGTSFSRDFDNRLRTTSPVNQTDPTRVQALATRPVQLADTILVDQESVIHGSGQAGATALASTAAGQKQKSLRSVRSQALRETPAAPAEGRDDLKRIRGIGVLIEKKLNSLGIGHYAQIADWSQSEVDQVNQALDFKGRIEREKWVEQARILASGGQTEFSRRIDKGDG